MSSEINCTVAEAAKILKLTEYTVRKKIREGDIIAIKGESDREGYRIPYEELINYAKNNGRSDLVGILGLGLSAALPFAATIGAGFSKIAEALNEKPKKKINHKKIRDLSIESLRDEIEATEYYIQALEIDGGNLSKDEKKRILEAKAKIKVLERQIKEIELKYELNTNISD